MLGTIFSVLLIAYVPGALLFRMPAWNRAGRAALAADERGFWHVVTSLMWSLAIVMILATVNVYSLHRLLAVNGGLCVALLAVSRGRLGYRGTSRRAALAMIGPIAIVALGCWRFFPSAEYVMGGKDPGVYISEGIQMAKQGSLFIREPVVAAVPAADRALFFPERGHAEYFSNRFMGFFLLDPVAGVSVGQFPQLYPASIALAWDLGGLTWARGAVGAWAVLGLLAVYFAAARFVGRGAAFAAALLLGVHVLEVWFARSPGSEPAAQVLVFAALLALGRSQQDGDRFFAPVAGGAIALLVLLRVDVFLLMLILVSATLALVWIVQRRPPSAGLLVPLAAGAVVGWWYVNGPMRAYSIEMRGYLSSLPFALVVSSVAAAGVIGYVTAVLVKRRVHFVLRAVPMALTAVTIAAALYAMFFRHDVTCQAPCGKLAAADAYALRTFTDFFLTRWGLLAALAGLGLALSRRFWSHPSFVVVVIGSAFSLFYKTHIVATHFWMDRRFLPVVLPGLLVCVAAAAVGAVSKPWRPAAIARVTGGAVFLALLGWHYAAAAEPIMRHVEYETMINSLESLAARFTPSDLVLVEARNAGGDTHVLAPPLAYIYDRQVLVLDSARPDKAQLRQFLENAAAKYAHVYFLGGGGTDLLSRQIQARAVANQRVRLNEYASTDWNVYPTGVRRKDFDYTVYELTVGSAPSTGRFVLNVGYEDDLYVVRFYAKDFNGSDPMRWTAKQSSVSVPNLSGREREVVLTMHDGGRPKQAPPATVQVFFDNVEIGTIAVGSGFQPYRLTIPAALAEKAARMDDPVQLRLVSTTWNPHTYLGTNDDRDLGVMLSRVEVH